MGTLDIAVVIAGAGARGAYEAGLLAQLLPEIAATVQATGDIARFSFIGTSAGSLNSVLIASRAPHVSPADTPQQVRDAWAAAMDAVTGVWCAIHEDKVFSITPSGRLLAAFTRVLPVGRVPLVSLLNTHPLTQLADDEEIVSWEALHHAVEQGRVGAVGAATTARDGRTVVFLDRHDPRPALARDCERDIDYVECDRGLLPQHVLASSAIPVLFPAQRITVPTDWTGWYYDGGVRLNTPLKPALELGLEHLVIVGTHPDRYERTGPPDPGLPQPELDEAAVPVANQIMADQIIQDLITLRRRNATGARQVRYVFAGPQRFDVLAELARTAATQFTAARLLRGLLGERARHELSSYLLFDRGYLGASVKEGRKRAKAIGVHDPAGGVAWSL